MAGFFKSLSKYIFYSEEKPVKGFVLEEKPDEKSSRSFSDDKESNKKEQETNKSEKAGKSKEDEKANDSGFKKPRPISSESGQNGQEKGKSQDNHSERKEKSKTTQKSHDGEEISTDLAVNLEYLKKVYDIPTNSDVLIREFEIVVKDKLLKAAIIFIDGMTDRKVINMDIMQPLMLLSNLDIKDDSKELYEYVKNHLLPHNQLKVTQKFKDIIGEVNFGGCGILIDTLEHAFTADVKGWEHRMVERPNTELVIRGPQEGFTELLRANSALIRKILKDEDLVNETVEIGRRSRTPCSVLYIKDVANESLVNEVKRRLKSIKVDYMLDSGELEQLIEDRTFLPSPQVIATERPDRAASHLTEGKVVIIVNGSPFALIVPATYVEMLHSPEDSYVRFPYANFLRGIRFFGAGLSLLLPGLYIAITNYHQEMIPTDLLIAIEASREKVPFPSVVEIIIMEVAFELIREAGIRIPGPIGPTLGIIGALILGQAAVAANIVSPILIIIVAVTGIGSFAIPNFSLGFAFRMLRFAYILLGAVAGFLGITTGIFIHGLMLANTRSFGVPFLAPFGPKTTKASVDEITRAPTWEQELRPDFLNAQDDFKQPEISRGWVKGDDDGQSKQ